MYIDEELIEDTFYQIIDQFNEKKAKVLFNNFKQNTNFLWLKWQNV